MSRSRARRSEPARSSIPRRARRPARSRSPHRPRSTERSTPPRRPSPAGARHRCRGAPRCCSRPRAARRACRKELAALITAEHGKVLSDAMGEVARGIENVEFACGVPQLLKGEFSEQVVDRRRRLLDPPAARRRRRHHAVQLPGDGAAVDGVERDRVRQRLRAEAVREGSERRRCSSPRSSHEAGVPDGRVQRRARRQDGGRPICSVTRRRRGELRRLHADRAVRLRDRQRRTASACRRSVAPRTTWSCCPTPTSPQRPMPRVGAAYGSAGERCMADLGRRRGRRRRRRARRRDRSAAPDAAHRTRSRPGLRDGAADHRASTATRSPAYIDSASADGATIVVDGRDVDGRRRRLLPRRLAARPRDAGDGGVPRRDLRSGAVRRARRDVTTRRSRWSTRTRTGNGAAIFTRDGGAARRFQFEVRRAWSA